MKWKIKLGKGIVGSSQMAQWIKKSTCNSGDPGLIPGLGRHRGEGNGNPL